MSKATFETEQVAGNTDNRGRAFADLVNIDAWHEPFGKDRVEVDLHADVVFDTARVGGESESKVRFRLSVRRAEVVVVTGATEPVRVRKDSVARDAPDFTGRRTEKIDKSVSTTAKAGMFARIGNRGANAAAEVGAAIARETSKQEELELTEKLRLFRVTQSQTSDGSYRWTIETHTGGVLRGKPWDAQEEPRLSLEDLRRDKTKGIAPSVSLEVRCRREDLKIEGIEIKDETLWQRLRLARGAEYRLSAAEAYIRNRLAEVGLEVGNIEEKFGEITLATIVADEK